MCVCRYVFLEGYLSIPSQNGNDRQFQDEVGSRQECLSWLLDVQKQLGDQRPTKDCGTPGLRDGNLPNFPETFGESVQSIIFSSHKCCWSCKLVLWRYARYACRAQVVLNLLETSWTSPNILHVPPLFLHVSSFPQELLTEFAEKTLKEGKVIPGTLAEKTWPQCRSTERGTGRIPKKKLNTAGIDAVGFGSLVVCHCWDSL